MNQKSRSKAVPARLQWAVATLAVAPTDHVLEVGCGTGIAACLVARELTAGRLVAIDRSAKMAVKAQSLLAATAPGNATVLPLELSQTDFDSQRFDKAYAFNVNVFWTHLEDETGAFAALKRCLEPAGRAYLFYQLPHDAIDKEFLRRLARSFADHGFQKVATHVNAEATVRSMCLVVQPA